MAKRADSPAKTVTVFLSRLESDPAVVVVRLPSPPGGVKVDFAEEVRPGGDFDGLPYADLLALGPGRHEVPASRFRASGKPGKPGK